jgi:acyl-CoA dehydrogenase
MVPRRTALVLPVARSIHHVQERTVIEFSLSEELLELQAKARAFAQNEIAPIAAEYDRRAEVPLFIFERATQAGLNNLLVPKEYGGEGYGALAIAIAAEELGVGCAGITITMLVSGLALLPILFFGTAEQKHTYVKGACEQNKLSAFCLTEREAGSDASAIQTTAILHGDEYVINGTKCFVTNGALADQYVVFALTDPNRGARSMSAFIVPRQSPGSITITKIEDKMGQRASNTAEIRFENVRVPRAHLLDRVGRGFRIALHALDYGRSGVAALSVGIARAALEAALAYAKERVQFGKPIFEQQAIQFMLADMATRVEAARLLTWQAAWRIDQGLKVAREASMAKCYASDVAMAVTSDAVQILGGYGYMKDYPVEKLMRDAKILQIYEGTNQIQRLVIARNL